MAFTKEEFIDFKLSFYDRNRLNPYNIDHYYNLIKPHHDKMIAMKRKYHESNVKYLSEDLAFLKERKEKYESMYAAYTNEYFDGKTITDEYTMSREKSYCEYLIKYKKYDLPNDDSPYSKWVNRWYRPRVSEEKYSFENEKEAIKYAEGIIDERQDRLDKESKMLELWQQQIDKFVDDQIKINKTKFTEVITEITVYHPKFVKLNQIHKQTKINKDNLLINLKDYLSTYSNKTDWDHFNITPSPENIAKWKSEVDTVKSKYDEIKSTVMKFKEWKHQAIQFHLKHCNDHVNCCESFHPSFHECHPECNLIEFY